MSEKSAHEEPGLRFMQFDECVPKCKLWSDVLMNSATSGRL